jgi:ABC-type multidrug transport system fused ATPase/permease subunit
MANNIYLIGIFLILNGVANSFHINSIYSLKDMNDINNENQSKFILNENLTRISTIPFNSEYKSGFFKFILFGVLNCLCVFLADFLFTWTSIKCSFKLHNSLLYSILKCDMKFFESTPCGRILNRFAKDIECLESKIPSFFKHCTRFTFTVFSVLIVIVINTWQILFILLPLFILYFLIQRFYTRFARQIKRLESISRSPIYAFFAESLSGICTIRAFKSEKRYLKQMQQHLNDNFKIFLADMFANRYVKIT